MSELIIRESLLNLRTEEPALEAMFNKEIPRHLGRVAIFEEVGFDSDKHPTQRMDVIGLRGELASAGTLQVLGRVAFKEAFNEYVNIFKSIEQTLADASDIIDNGQKLLFLTTHERTDDIAAAYGAFIAEMQDYRIRYKYPDEQINSQILISKLIAGMGALGAYVPNLLADNLGDVLLTLPPSRSVRSSDISRDGRLAYNTEIKNLMREDNERLQKIGKGLIRAVAANGSTFVSTSRFFGSKRNSPRMHAGPLASGTIDMMKEHKILPVAVHINGKNPSLKVHAIQPPVNNEDEAHEIMNLLIEDMTELSGKKHKYYKTREDFEDAISYKVIGKTFPVNSQVNS